MNEEKHNRDTDGFEITIVCCCVMDNQTITSRDMQIERAWTRGDEKQNRDKNGFEILIALVVGIWSDHCITQYADLKK